MIRQTVPGICEALLADTRAVGDIKLAATEACTDVVLHAYAGRDDGTIELDPHARAEEFQLVVRDHGNGMTPRPSPKASAWPAADRGAHEHHDDRGAHGGDTE